MASPSSSLASRTAFGSLKWVVAFTTALARASGSLDLKMPEPTKTASAPRLRTNAASAGVAIPPAEKFGTGSLPDLATARTKSSGAPSSLAKRMISSSRSVVRRFISLTMVRMWRTASTTLPGAGFALGANHRRAFGDAAERFAEIARAANERDAIVVLPDVILFVGGSKHFALVDEIDFERLQNFGFGEVADANFGHHGNRDGVHDFANDLDAGHARDAAFFADVGGDALERHDGAGAGFLGDLGLRGVGDVHDHAALEHFGEADFYAPGVFADEIGAVARALGGAAVRAVCVTVAVCFLSVRLLRVHRDSPRDFQIRFRLQISKTCCCLQRNSSERARRAVPLAPRL